MIIKTLASILVALTMITACISSSSTTISSDKRQVIANQLDPRMIQGNNRLGLNIHQQLVEQHQSENVFISPISITMALGLTLNGAAGETYDEMARALGWETLTEQEIKQAIPLLMQLLQQPGKGIETNIANSLWHIQSFKPHQAFLDLNKKIYQAEVSSVDFQDPQSIQRINKWVSKQTKNKINQIISHPVSYDLVMLLLNAMYFKGNWTKPFASEATREAPFHLADGSTKQVMMMSQSGRFEYLKQSGFQAIRLPYGEGQMSMLIIVPDDASNLAALHEQIWSSPELFQQQFTMSQGHIEIPRFRIEFETQLNDALQGIGIERAFQGEQADFSRMAPVPPQLFISEVKHKTLLEVNEQGSEAAAVTSIGITPTSAPVDFFQLKVNQPFFAAIEDRQTGAWLFIGTITDPS